MDKNIKKEAAEKYSNFEIAKKQINLMNQNKEKPLTPNPAHKWVQKNAE